MIIYRRLRGVRAEEGRKEKQQKQSLNGRLL